MNKQEQNKAIVQSFNTFFIEQGKMSVFNELVSENFINHSAGQGVSKGKDGVEYFFNHLLRPAFPDLKVVIHDQMAEEDKVITRKSFFGTHRDSFFGIPPSNRLIEMEVIDIIKIKDGKISEHWNVLDWHKVFSQLTS